MVFLCPPHYLLIDLINPCKLWLSDFPLAQEGKGMGRVLNLPSWV